MNHIAIAFKRFSITALHEEGNKKQICMTHTNWNLLSVYAAAIILFEKIRCHVFEIFAYVSLNLDFIIYS